MSILSIHIYISRGKPNSKACPNGILGPSPARMDCMCFATACQNWWCARAFIPCQKRSPLDQRSTRRHGKPSICRSIIYSTIFTNISYIFFFFTRSAITPRPGVEKWFNKSPLSTTWTSRRCDGWMVRWFINGLFMEVFCGRNRRKFARISQTSASARFLHPGGYGWM